MQPTALTFKISHNHYVLLSTTTFQGWRIDLATLEFWHFRSIPLACLQSTAEITPTKAEWKSLISESNWSLQSSGRAWQAGGRGSFLSACIVRTFFLPSSFPCLLPEMEMVNSCQSQIKKKSSELSPSADKLFKRLNQTGRQSKFLEECRGLIVGVDRKTGLVCTEPTYSTHDTFRNQLFVY